MIRAAFEDKGVIDYKECWDYQQTVFQSLIDSKSGGHAVPAGQTIILCEHPHVYTLGKSGDPANFLINDEFLARINAEYYRIDRGGDITYHGPGQLVGYPILDLEALGSGLKEYIYALERSIIDTIADFGITGSVCQGATGVWLPPSGEKGQRKICAIGIRSSRFVTMHGFALNVNTQMEYFDYINPCGFTDRGVTSMERELGKKIEMEEVKEGFLAHFARIMNIKIDKLCQLQKNGFSSRKEIPKK